MQLEVAGLLARGAIVDPGSPLTEFAEGLVVEGVARRRTRGFVRCANPADFDYVDADPACVGRVAVPEDGMDDWVWCPRCERRLETSRKQRLDAIVLEPDAHALRARIGQMLEALGMSVREHPEGVFRVESGDTEAAVVLMDACDSLPIRFALTADQGAIAVAADCGKFRWQLPRDTPLLSAAELMLLSPEPLLAAVRAALAGAPRVVVVAPPPASAAPVPVARFPLPPGAGWGDIAIYYVDGATVGIAAPGARPVHASAIELGMAKENSRAPSRRFALLLHLCRHRGRTDWKTAGFAEDEPLAFDNFAAFRMQVSPLRRDLQLLFGLAGDPFAPIGRSKPLVAAFRALPEAPGELAYLPRAE
jgi:hypothetical protein